MSQMGEFAALQNTFFRCDGIIRRADLGCGHVELAQPDGWVGRVKGHARIVPHREGKTKPADRAVGRGHSRARTGWRGGEAAGAANKPPVPIGGRKNRIICPWIAY